MSRVGQQQALAALHKTKYTSLPVLLNFLYKPEGEQSGELDGERPLSSLPALTQRVRIFFPLNLRLSPAFCTVSTLLLFGPGQSWPLRGFFILSLCGTVRRDRRRYGFSPGRWELRVLRPQKAAPASPGLRARAHAEFLAEQQLTRRFKTTNR